MAKKYSYSKLGLTALIPRYYEGEGNGTEVYFKDGTCIKDTRKIKAILKELAKEFAVDLVQIRKNSGEVIGQKQQVPIPFSPELILIPLKVRSPMVEGDGSYGYFSLEAIERVEGQDNDTSIINIKGKRRLTVLQRNSSVEKWINHGKILQNASIKQQGNFVYYLRGGLGEFSKPATKGDIILIVKEISELKEMIFPNSTDMEGYE